MERVEAVVQRQQRVTILARPLTKPLMVVSVKVWPPAERSVIQIGRFTLPYSLE